MLLHHVAENQIKELLKLKAIQKPKKLNNPKRKQNPKNKERGISNNLVLKLDAKINVHTTEIKPKTKSYLLPKEKIKLPKKSGFRKQSKTYYVYNQITKYGMGKLIYINSK